jgi:hypothetical protein
MSYPQIYRFFGTLNVHRCQPLSVLLRSTFLCCSGPRLMASSDLVGRRKPPPHSEPLPHVSAGVPGVASQHQQSRCGEHPSALAISEGEFLLQAPACCVSSILLGPTCRGFPESCRLWHLPGVHAQNSSILPTPNTLFSTMGTTHFKK